MPATIADFLVSLGFNVDDASRAKAEQSYARYERAVRDAEDRVQKAKEAGAKASVQVAARKELDQAKEALAAAKAAGALEDAEKRKTKAAQDGAKAQADAIGFAVAKFEVFLHAAEAMARGAVTAVENVVTAYKELHYEAGRTGATVGGLQAIGYAFKQIGGSSQEVIGAIDGFAKALTNPGLQGFVKGLGVDLGKPREQQFLDTIERLSKEKPYIGVQQAEMLGIPEPVFKRAVQQLDELKRRQAERAETVRAMGLNEEEAGKASARLMQSFGSLTMTLQVGLDKLITDQLPRVSGWFDSLTTWIRSHQPEISDFVRGLADRLEKFGGAVEQAFKNFQAGLEDGSIQKGLQEFSERIGRLADGLERMAKAAESFFRFSDKFNDLGFGPIVSGILGLGGGGGVPGVGAVGGYNPLEVNPGGSPAIRKPDDRTWWQRHAPTALGGRPDPNASADSSGGLRARASRALRGDQSGGVAANPGAYKDVLDHIARSEGTAHRPGGGYNTSLANGLLLPEGKEQDLTKLTLDQIDALQTGMLRNPANRWNSSALGRYQIVRTTLRAQREKLGLKGSDLFDAQVQDRIGANLARQRGADPVGLQNEWASLVGAKNATAVALMQKVDPKASIMPASPPLASAPPKVDIILKAPAPAQSSRSVKLPDYMNGPGGFDVNALTSPSAPLGANSAPVNNTDASRTVTLNQNNTNNVTVSGSNDPQTHGRVMEGALGRVHQTLLENTQSVVRG